MKKILTLCGLLMLVSCSKENRGWVYMPDMVFPVPYESFSENELTVDGKSMLVQVDGTIARGKMPYAYGTSEEEAIKAGNELVDPYPETIESKARGKEVFANFCMPCHGENGEGDGPVVQKKFPAPPDLKSERLMSFSKGRIFHVVTRGFNTMPSHASQVLEKDRWYVAQFIKEFQSKK